MKNAEKAFIASGNAGLRCPACPENKFNKRHNINFWLFNKAEEDGTEDWEQGGVVVSCSVHAQSSD